MPPLSGRDGLSRRRFLELMGASLALAGASACAPPHEKIVPYVRPPEQTIPGKPRYFATAHVLGGYATGTLVESHLGRPTKIEGNPKHPGSLGATDHFAQADVLTLYDPGRAESVTFNGQVRAWSSAVSAIRAQLEQLRADGGAGLRFLTETVTSPTLAAQRDAIARALPNARWHVWEPVHRDAVRSGAQLAFGAVVDTRYRFDAADVIVTLDADPLAFDPSRVRLARELASRRTAQQGMSRLYAVESAPTRFGSLADHRLPLTSHAIEGFALALASALGVNVGGSAAVPSGAPSGWIDAVVSDLRGAGGRALIVPGEFQSPLVHAAAHASNVALGGVGITVDYADPVEIDTSNRVDSLRSLVSDMQAGQVQLLLMLGGNPVYSAPSDVPFASALRSVTTSIQVSQYFDETAEIATWHIPESHPLETWTDARAADGTTTIMQPLIAPLHDSKSVHEVLGLFGDSPEASSHDVVKSFWQSRQGSGSDFETFWQTSLSNGLVAGTQQPARQVTLRPDWYAGQTPAASLATGALELVFRPDDSLHDGRFAANTWLLELPRPLTKLSWDNVAHVSPATARQLGVQQQDVVELRASGGVVQAPVLLQPGMADGSVVVTLGYGRGRGAGVGAGVGFNAGALRVADAPWLASDLTLARTGSTHELVTTQGHYTMEGRDLVVDVDFDEFQRDGKSAIGDRNQPPTESLYPAFPYEGNKWGMVIDLNACSGCNACIVACQSENNIPVVGKQEVGRGREMYWLRVDSYFEGDEQNPRILQQLVPCMQCENAPCELVCPVGATTHSDEGLNDMTYNRCVGTRYCSNNCPYKVRHFNFLEYSDYHTELFKMLRNPDVSVRERGVMEKCTYCVQRITAARIQSEKEGRPIMDGEVVTACQAACPTTAITFGNLNDPNSQVARLRKDDRNYTLLAELNTRPRTTYLARVRNANPAIVALEGVHAG
jgi:Fe-S-cluster-containing dehydrogenase component